jgi:hypothetical protein
LAGDDNGAPPWDPAGAGGGEGPPELDGEGEDESVDGGGADEGGGLLFGGGGAVEELDDMARGKRRLGRIGRACEATLAFRSAPPLHYDRHGAAGGETEDRSRGSATDVHDTEQRSAPHGTRMPAAYFIPPPSHLTRGEK